MKKNWKIAEDADDWEGDWQGSERFHLRYFRALTFTAKVRAVENMGRTAAYFLGKAQARRKETPPRD